MSTSDSRKRSAEADDLDDLSRDALVARVRAAEDQVAIERAFAARVYRDVETVLDEYLGTKDDDGAGEGLAGDVRLAIERPVAELVDALAARDAVAAELAALREALGRLVDRWSESEHWPTVDHAVALAVLLDETRGERPSPDGQHGRPVVLNPEAIGDPDQTPVVQLSRGESDE